MIKVKVLTMARAVFCGLVLWAISACDQGSPYVKEVKETPRTYYRVTADYSVKATGEKISFDYVVVCGGTVTRWTYTSPSVAGTIYPELMILPTATGEAVGVRTPRLCDAGIWGYDFRAREWTDKTKIPDDFMTFAMWFPDLNDMSFAIGYESDLAYKSPYAKLEFIKADAVLSNKEEWTAWREQSAVAWGDAVIGGLPGPWGYNWHFEDKAFQAELRARAPGGLVEGKFCYGGVRLKLPDDWRAVLEQFKPADAKNYWVPVWSTVQMRPARKAFFEKYGGARAFNGGRFRDHVPGDSMPELGVRRSGGELIYRDNGTELETRGGRVVHGQGRGNFYHDQFPIIAHESYAFDEERKHTITRKLLVSDDWNGFSICSRGLVSAEMLEAYSLGEVPAIEISYAHGLKEFLAIPSDQVKTQLYVNDVIIHTYARFARPPSGGTWIIDDNGYLFPSLGYKH